MGIRTDLAMEAKALWEKSAGKTTKLAGVRARERERDGFAVTEVHIKQDHSVREERNKDREIWSSLLSC